MASGYGVDLALSSTGSSRAEPSPLCTPASLTAAANPAQETLHLVRAPTCPGNVGLPDQAESTVPRSVRWQNVTVNPDSFDIYLSRATRAMYVPDHTATPHGSSEQFAALDSLRVLNRLSESVSAGGWSSIIGIITAICGNILISFALNTQRYAHMRLSREQVAREERHRDLKARSKGKLQNYGTSQDSAVEEQLQEGSQLGPSDGPRRDYALEESSESHEAEPLISREDKRKVSASSSETLRPGEEQDEPPEKSYLNSPVWWVGIVLMVVGEAGNFLAYGFAPASIVSPLGVVALVSNCLIAPLLLGEKFRLRDGLGVVIAIGGCVTVVLSASDSNPKLTPDKIWRLISHWEFETYFGITAFLIVALSVASNKFGNKSILIDLGLVGLYGGYTALATKGIASLLSNTIWRVITFPITYLLLAVLIFTAVMQIKYVNRALQRFNATMVIPTQFVLFTISVIVGSAVLYRDFEREAAGDAAKFIGGCALTFLGVWCITSGREDGIDGDEELLEEEEAIDLVGEGRVHHGIGERRGTTVRQQSITASSSKGTPTLRRFHTADSIPHPLAMAADLRPEPLENASELQLEQHPSQDHLNDVPPANSAAIHSSSMALLHEDQRARDPSKPAPLHATTSAPIITQSDLASSFRPKTPLNRNHSGPLTGSPNRRSPGTPARDPRAGQLLDPQASHRLPHRPSVANLLPGPLTSPLSGSLSAIVADSLRRGVEIPSSTIHSRRSKSRRRTAGGSSFEPVKQAPTTSLKRHSIASGEVDFDDADPSDLPPGRSGIQGRARSLSATLSDIFGTPAKRQRLESRESIQEQHNEER